MKKTYQKQLRADSKKVAEQFAAKPCAHKLYFDIYNYKQSNGVDRFEVLCYECGEISGIKHKDARQHTFITVTYDKWRVIRENASTAKKYRIYMHREKYFWKYFTYGYYLNTVFWKNKRAKRMKLDNDKCQMCGSPAEQVHHINYDSLFDEHMEDLMAVCVDCHKKIHNID